MRRTAGRLAQLSRLDCNQFGGYFLAILEVPGCDICLAEKVQRLGQIGAGAPQLSPCGHRRFHHWQGFLSPSDLHEGAGHILLLRECSAAIGARALRVSVIGTLIDGETCQNIPSHFSHIGKISVDLRLIAQGERILAVDLESIFKSSLGLVQMTT